MSGSRGIGHHHQQGRLRASLQRRWQHGPFLPPREERRAPKDVHRSRWPSDLRGRAPDCRADPPAGPLRGPRQEVRGSPAPQEGGGSGGRAQAPPLRRHGRGCYRRQVVFNRP